MKGQFFIIGALALILFMFYAHYNARFDLPKTADYSQNLFSNMKTEILRSASYAYYQGAYSHSVESNVSSFVDFLRNVSTSHGQRLETLVIVMIPLSSSYNVSAINFLSQTIDLNITISGVEKNTTGLVDKGVAKFVFSGVDENATVSVTYMRAGAKLSDAFNITARKLNTYAEIRLLSSLSTWSDRVTG
ncbi:MAG: hypothetical protein V1836_02380 [Candidatus Aenigmatarchaeota archaeon]